ncbi:MAG: hypothetical protein ACYC9O_06850 [Candidatus Latescibacterota bacterium]
MPLRAALFVYRKKGIARSRRLQFPARCRVLLYHKVSAPAQQYTNYIIFILCNIYLHGARRWLAPFPHMPVRSAKNKKTGPPPAARNAPSPSIRHNVDLCTLFIEIDDILSFDMPVCHHFGDISSPCRVPLIRRYPAILLVFDIMSSTPRVTLSLLSPLPVFFFLLKPGNGAVSHQTGTGAPAISSGSSNLAEGKRITKRNNSSCSGVYF